MANVLVVDDSVIMRRNLSTILTKMGHTVVAEAANGEQAYLRYKSYRPDLVTMDITMPVSSGIEALEKIMNEDPDAKIVMVSALNQKNMVLEALERGAKHYIIKPISHDNIVKVINKVLGVEESLPDPAVPVPTIPEEARREKKSAEAADDSATRPFTIENINNTFLIKIATTLDNGSFEILNQAFQGLLFVKPLNVKLDLGWLESLEDPLLEKLGGIIKAVQDADGKIEIISHSKPFVESVKNKFTDGLTFMASNIVFKA